MTNQSLPIKVTRLHYDDGNYSVLIIFEHEDGAHEYAYELSYSFKSRIFSLDKTTSNSDVDEFVKKHSKVTHEEIYSFLEKWIDENQSRIFEQVFKEMPSFVEHGDEKYYFPIHCGQQYHSRELLNLLSNRVDRKHFEKAYVQTCLRDRSDGSRQCFSDFERTLGMLDEDKWFIGTNDATKDFEIRLNSFMQIDDYEPEPAYDCLIISFDTKPLEILC